MRFDQLRNKYNASSLLMRIIYINIAVFVVLRLAGVISFLAFGSTTSLVQWVEVPSSLWLLATRPWTVVTYMFSHYDVLHILFNMLWLYWLGRIFMDFFSPKQLTGLYLLGGWGGALLFLLAYNLLPAFAGDMIYLVGASASVMAIVVATAVYAPDYKIGLLFLGEVSLKWVVLAVIVIELVGFETNIAGNIAHIGGIIVGAWFGVRIKQGHDITRPLNIAIDALVGLFNGRKFEMPTFRRPKSQKRPSSTGTQQGSAASTQADAHRPADTVSEEELDIILAKIKASGYDALTDEERDKLFKVSRRRSP